MEENKKLALLRILHILLYHSDERHPLKQEEIAEYLEKDYGIVVERKAIGRQLALLHEAYDAPNSPIVLISDRRRGTYIEQREFEDTELRLLIDGVLSSRHITAKHSKACWTVTSPTDYQNKKSCSQFDLTARFFIRHIRISLYDPRYRMVSGPFSRSRMSRSVSGA